MGALSVIGKPNNSLQPTCYIVLEVVCAEPYKILGKGASHFVDCGYGAFWKRCPDILYCKTALSGSYAELYNQC